jgi:hypothetical protein
LRTRKFATALPRRKPLRLLSWPEGQDRLLDGNADGFPRFPRRDCVSFRRRFAQGPREFPKVFPFSTGRLAPLSRQSEDLRDPGSPKRAGVSNFQHRGGTSRCLHPVRPEGRPGPRRSPKGAPGSAGRDIWQLPQNWTLWRDMRFLRNALSPQA